MPNTASGLKLWSAKDMVGAIDVVGATIAAGAAGDTTSGEGKSGIAYAELSTLGAMLGAGEPASKPPVLGFWLGGDMPKTASGLKPAAIAGADKLGAMLWAGAFGFAFGARPIMPKMPFCTPALLNTASAAAMDWLAVAA
jgi:hypothetical protein